MQMPLLDSTSLSGHKEHRLALTQLAYIACAYVWQEGEKRVPEVCYLCVVLINSLGWLIDWLIESGLTLISTFCCHVLAACLTTHVFSLSHTSTRHKRLSIQRTAFLIQFLHLIIIMICDRHTTVKWSIYSNCYSLYLFVFYLAVLY